jgi:L-ribulose-5-phosphate 3-epimerase
METPRFAIMSMMLRCVGAEAVRAGAAAGYAGIELDIGPEAEQHPLFDEGGLAAARAELARTGLAVPSICLGALNAFGFKSADAAERARAHALVERGVALAASLGADAVLVPFFGTSRLESDDEIARVAEGLRGVAPAAERAGVTLAVENTLAAAQNVALVEAVGSPAVGVYYDTGNTLGAGRDPVDEVRALGTALARVHFKDYRPGQGAVMMGEGVVDFPAVAGALDARGYRQWIVMEAASPGDAVDDARANLAFAQRLYGRDA